MENQFGKYTLLKKLGDGGMAEVFLAEMKGPEGFSKRVAIKRILPHLCHDALFTESFINEARLGGYLNHHNIVQTLDFGQIDGFYYLAMEYVQGVNLRQILKDSQNRKSPIPLSVGLDIAHQICEGLVYAHVATDASRRPLKMIHRDLKPSNILLTSHGVVKIADFGVARAESNVAHTQLASGNPKGTVAYMSPEQALGLLDIDQRADIFSLGAILFELICNERIYTASTYLGALRQAQDAEIADRLSRADQLTHGTDVGAILRRALAPERDNRYRSSKQFSRDLRKSSVTNDADYGLSDYLASAIPRIERKEGGGNPPPSQNRVSGPRSRSRSQSARGASRPSQTPAHQGQPASRGGQSSRGGQRPSSRGGQRPSSRGGRTPSHPRRPRQSGGHHHGVPATAHPSERSGRNSNPPAYGESRSFQAMGAGGQGGLAAQNAYASNAPATGNDQANPALPVPTRTLPARGLSPETTASGPVSEPPPAHEPAFDSQTLNPKGGHGPVEMPMTVKAESPRLGGALKAVVASIFLVLTGVVVTYVMMPHASSVVVETDPPTAMITMPDGSSLQSPAEVMVGANGMRVEVSLKGYQTRQLDIPGNVPKGQIWQVSLDEAPTELRLAVNPPGAKITILGTVYEGESSYAIRDLPTGEPIQLIAKARGYQDKNEELTLSHGEITSFNLNLVKRKSRSKPKTTKPAAEPPKNPDTGVKRPAVQQVKRAQKGFLACNAVPKEGGSMWAKIFIDNTYVGNTPMLKHELRAGAHNLRLVAEDGQVRTKKITVEAGKTTRVLINF